jgi:serine/threonine protein kinase
LPGDAGLSKDWLVTPLWLPCRRRKRAASGVHFKEETVWAIFLQIALGVQYLHSHHVLHRCGRQP